MTRSLLVRRLLGALFIAFGTVTACDEPGCLTEAMLDLLAKFRGKERFSPRLWKRIKTCLESIAIDDDTSLVCADVSWAGFVENGISGIEWGQGSGWVENNPTPLTDDENSHVPGASNIIIMEPCNTVSNLAYYRASLAYCENEWSLDEEARESLVLMYSILALGSAFYHGGQTPAGLAVDVEAPRVTGFINLQHAVSSFPYEPMVYDLTETPRNITGSGLAYRFARILLDESVYDWQQSINDLELPSESLSFACLVVVLALLALPPKVADEFIEIISGVLLEDQFKPFVQTYKGRVQELYAERDVAPRFRTQVRLFFACLGTLLKVLYAFFWQEQQIPGPHINSAAANVLGAVLMPAVNRLGNLLTGFDRSSDLALQLSVNVYPDSGTCSRAQAHSKWHEQTANSLVDVTHLSIAADSIIRGDRFPFLTNIELQRCMEDNDCFSDFDSDYILPKLSDAFDTCIEHVTRNWPEPDTGSFFDCLLPAILQHDRGSSSESLDSCLIKNDCIKFDAYGGIETSTLSQCIGFGRLREGRAACRSYVNPFLLTPCLLACRTDNLCALRCLQKHGELSSSADTGVSCMNVLFDPNGPHAQEDMESCISESDMESSSPMLNSLVKGLPKLTTCSTKKETCQASYSRFVNGAQEVFECAESCRSNLSWGFVIFDFLPRQIACTLQCYLLSN